MYPSLPPPIKREKTFRKTWSKRREEIRSLEKDFSSNHNIYSPPRNKHLRPGHQSRGKDGTGCPRLTWPYHSPPSLPLVTKIYVARSNGDTHNRWRVNRSQGLDCSESSCYGPHISIPHNSRDTFLRIGENGRGERGDCSPWFAKSNLLFPSTSFLPSRGKNSRQFGHRWGSKRAEQA